MYVNNWIENLPTKDVVGEVTDWARNWLREGATVWVLRRIKESNDMSTEPALCHVLPMAVDDEQKFVVLAAAAAGVACTETLAAGSNTGVAGTWDDLEGIDDAVVVVIGNKVWEMKFDWGAARVGESDCWKLDVESSTDEREGCKGGGKFMSRRSIEVGWLFTPTEEEANEWPMSTTLLKSAKSVSSVPPLHHK